MTRCRCVCDWTCARSTSMPATSPELFRSCVCVSSVSAVWYLSQVPAELTQQPPQAINHGDGGQPAALFQYSEEGQDLVREVGPG